ncbi:MAG: hypothetical protein NC218_00525 [Acetobacter sp.]|nr:hypothetical protein [Acetobacter sp.]
MLKRVFLVLLFVLMTSSVYAQTAALNKAKYVAVLKVITDHKMNDAELKPDVDKLREYERFQDDLRKMMAKLDNSRPNEAKNRRIMRILEKTGKQIYDELK